MAEAVIEPTQKLFDTADLVDELREMFSRGGLLRRIGNLSEDEVALLLALVRKVNAADNSRLAELPHRIGRNEAHA